MSHVNIRLASPEVIRGWSSGEVTRSETINYRTLKPVKDGLFCERIFGPEKDWECSCRKYKGVRYDGLVCEQCGVKVAHSRVRRKRMGHIELAVPVVHIWFWKIAPCRIGALLGMKASDLEKVVGYQNHAVLDAGDSDFEPGRVITEDEYREVAEEPIAGLRLGIGGAAVKELLQSVHLDELAASLRTRLDKLGETAAQAKHKPLVRRLEMVEGLRKSDTRPEWMVLDALPIIPPDLRPVVRLDSGNFATSDLNDLYRRILDRNNRLKKLLSLSAPEVIVRNEKRLLQQAVDALFDNERGRQKVVGSGNRPLKSLADAVKGKQGLFRQNLLGKRVDYSARAVIVVGPELKLHQCGLPKKIALELYQPFLVRWLRDQGFAPTVKRARDMIKRRDEIVWTGLEEVVRGRPVLLNRAPTLHRLGIQAFEPLLTEGNAIRLHPLVCKGFNADFDGDTMAVHLPLSVQAQREARERMTPARNLFSAANGQPALTPSQDIVLGCAWLTAAPGADKETRRQGDKEKERLFASPAEVILAHDLGKAGTHDRVRVRFSAPRLIVRMDPVSGLPVSLSPCLLVSTTVGRVLFNDVLPSSLPFYDLPLSVKPLAGVIDDCHRLLGPDETVRLLDRIKALGFAAATRSGVTFAMDDLRTCGGKEAVIAETEAAAEDLQRWYRRGLLSAEDKDRKLVELWSGARDQITAQVMDDLAADNRSGVNPIHLMVTSGARGGLEQVRQLAGMRGLMARPNGRVIEMPVTASFREGLSVLEYFASTHGARKGLVDTALKTADAGYLTRKLADVAQDVVITMEDCGTGRGLERKAAESAGRVACERVEGPTGEVIVRSGEVITRQRAEAMAGLEVQGLRVRSPLTCRAPRGICRLCYGTDLSTGELVQPGTAVGIVAAQSVGEPGTQLTMRTFHLGGALSKEDITRGLPRVEELFDAQRPANPAVLAAVNAVVVSAPEEGIGTVVLRPVNAEGRRVGKARSQGVPEGRRVMVRAGERVTRGQPLTDGTIDPHALLGLCGARAVQDYLVREVQAVYRSQRVDIDDRHIEVLVGQMLRKVRVTSAGDTELVTGSVIDRHTFEEANGRLAVGKERASAVPGEPAGRHGTLATCRAELLGVTRAALHADSFLSAASFQETTKVLTEAALAGKVDPLAGLKENVIVGELVPAGTGRSLPCLRAGSAGREPEMVGDEHG